MVGCHSRGHGSADRGGDEPRAGPATNPGLVEERFTTVEATGMTLCWSACGEPDRPAILLVMGLGLSMDWWRDDFCRTLADAGHHVIRFDNRDVGRSTHLSGRGVGPLGFLTRRTTPVYTLADMADDAAGLIGEIPGAAHVVGVSLGALVAQEIAIRHPDRVRSLTSIMGRPGDRRTGKVSWRMTPEFLRPPGRDPVEDMVRSFRRIGSTERTQDDDQDVRFTMRRAMARETGTDGSGRQLAACIAERDRTADLGRLRMPVAVIHGDRDRVITPSGGRATAAAVPGAELVEIPGMGHDLARRHWPRVIDVIARTAARA